MTSFSGRLYSIDVANAYSGLFSKFVLHVASACSFPVCHEYALAFYFIRSWYKVREAHQRGFHTYGLGLGSAMS